MIELEQVLRLPVVVEHTIPPTWLDANGHMNMMYYTGLGNMSFDRFFKVLGIPFEHFRGRGRSFFALQQVLHYLNELREGDKVEVHSGLVGHDTKRIHFMYYVVNISTGKLASTDERISSYMDMATRRTTPFEPDIVEQLDRALTFFSGLGWTPELSGTIKLKK